MEVPERPVEPSPPEALEVPEPLVEREGGARPGEIPEVPGSPEEEGLMPALPGGPVFEGGRGIELKHVPTASKKDTPSWLRWNEYNSDAKLVPVSVTGITPKPFIGGLSIFMADAFKPRPNSDAEKRVSGFSWTCGHRYPSSDTP